MSRHGNHSDGPHPARRKGDIRPTALGRGVDEISGRPIIGVGVCLGCASAGVDVRGGHVAVAVALGVAVTAAVAVAVGVASVVTVDVAVVLLVALLSVRCRSSSRKLRLRLRSA